MNKVSEMIIAVAGDVLQRPDSKEEMEAHLEIVICAWNMSLYSANKRKIKLNKFIESQKPYAPNSEALKGLEWEIRRIMKQKNTLYPKVKKKIEFAEVIETGEDNYIIRAYSTNDAISK